MLLRKKIPEYITEEIEISSDSDREDFDEENSNVENSDEENLMKKIKHKIFFIIFSIYEK